LGVAGFCASDEVLFGIFRVNITLNIIHVMTGILAISSGMKEHIVHDLFFSGPVVRTSGSSFTSTFIIVYFFLALGEIVYGIIEGIGSHVHYDIGAEFAAMGFLHLALCLVVWHLVSKLSKEKLEE
jgi:hypothetical protein